MTRRPFQRSHFGLGDGTADAIADLVTIGVQAGSSIAQTSIAAKAQQKLAEAQAKHAKDMAVLEQKKLAIQARLEAARAKAAQATTDAPTVTTSSVPTWALALGGLLFVGAGGLWYYKTHMTTASAKGA